VSVGELESFGVTVYEGGEVFPLEDLETLEGETFDPAGLAGNYVFINIWASWCPYCGKERESIQGLYERYGGERFEMVTIAAGEEVETVRAYLEGKGYTFPAVVDRGNRLRENYAPRIPKSYILDGEGKIIARIDGAKEWTEEGSIRIVEHLTGDRRGKGERE
jgi:thiol-disulfide isomerase/thioredoxin